MGLQQEVQGIRAALDAGRPEQALAPAEELLRCYPEYPTAYLLLAETYAALRWWKKAEALLQRAQQCFPRHKGIHRLMQYRGMLPGSFAPGAKATPPVGEPSYPESEQHAGVPRDPGVRETVQRWRRPETTPLRLIEGAGDATVRLRSSIVGLIPGLEFAPLRHEPSPVALWFSLPAPPPFPAEVERALGEAEHVSPTGTTRLEELAQRLERARIPVPDEGGAPLTTGEVMVPPVATETMARIYEQQGAYELALRVYEELVRRYPEKRSLYEEAQARLRERLRHADS
ncbi:MAG: tetratricopeptide repeat protein [Bacteroidota bacterium]|nr:tetratricopeptide repeat protein [Bacteroidota bacterium]